MRCPVKDPWTGRCPNPAEVELPNKRKVCKPHAREWSQGRIAEHTKGLAEARAVERAAS